MAELKIISSISNEQLLKMNCLAESDCSLELVKRGKVRDIYRFQEKLAIVNSDRQSAFDRNLALVPLKGWVLNLQSAWWFERCQDIIANHFLCLVAGRLMLVKAAELIPIEVVVRGYLTGSTSTSIWYRYSQGERVFDDLKLQDGLEKNSALARAIITPTTKDEVHDQAISNKEAAALVGSPLWQKIRQTALALFARGQELSKPAGLALIDTKYEFGLTKEGELLLIDELHSSDSSRFLPLNAWQKEKFSNNFHLDKEFLRLWVTKHYKPYEDKTISIPKEIILEQAQRYLYLYEKLSSQNLASQLERFLTEETELESLLKEKEE